MFSQAALGLSLLLVGLVPASLPTAPHGLHDLDISVHETSIEVSKGVPDDLCALVVGINQKPVILPHTALLLVDPLAIAALGAFDRYGEYHFEFGHLIPKEGVSAIVQGVTVRGATGLFATTPVLSLDY